MVWYWFVDRVDVAMVYVRIDAGELFFFTAQTLNEVHQYTARQQHMIFTTAVEPAGTDAEWDELSVHIFK